MPTPSPSYGDGTDTCTNDCDDNEPENYPNNVESCDGEDNDCDELTDEGLDLDGDGFTPCGVDGDLGTAADNDCDDADAANFPVYRPRFLGHMLLLFRPRRSR